jgi:hypothetical protein
MGPEMTGARGDLFQPHPPTADPFADTWYCYLNDPGVGYLKIVFLSYLNDRTEGAQHAHVHVALAPVGGGRHEHDAWFREVAIEQAQPDGTGRFGFHVPGVVAIDGTSFSLALPEVMVEARFTGPHHHYFPEPQQAASPFFGPLDHLPSDQSHWFVHTLGTAATYHYEEDSRAHAGSGLMYAERGWSVRQAHGFCYLMAVGEGARLMLTCGMPDDRTEVWAGRLVTPATDLTFVPLSGDPPTVTSDLQPDQGRAGVTLVQDEHEVRITSHAPLADFYDQITPSLTVFHAEHPVAKTMQAALHIEVRRNGEVVDVVDLPQSILEFGGVLYPPALAVMAGPGRPEYRYSEI